MILDEIVKSFLKDNDTKEPSSVVPDKNVLADFSDSMNTGSFFDHENSALDFFGIGESNRIEKQAKKIDMYRELATRPEIIEAIDIIVNEVVFAFDEKYPVKLVLGLENDKLEEKIQEKFEKILVLMDVRDTLYRLVKQSYIDGQYVLHLPYKKNSVKQGIQSIQMIDPKKFYWDKKQEFYTYAKEDYSPVEKDPLKQYSKEEIVRGNFGLYDGYLVLSYLESALKPSNMLGTLEDLLIPLRFSRSISRRVFNVDIGDLPPTRGKEVMKEYQDKFRYRKFYNADTGEISNQQHITSMVEDYWFANRNGGKGTQVEMLDESGNLGELGDIKHFTKKLYKALNVPTNRINVSDDGQLAEFDFQSTNVTQEDMRFFMFTSRIRNVYSEMFMNILEREVISTGILKQKEWDDLKSNMKVEFTSENLFLERMKTANLENKLNVFRDATDNIGKIFSAQTALRKIFDMNEDEVKEELKLIKKEAADPLFEPFYKEDGGF